MRPKIRCDREFWKFLRTKQDLNQAVLCFSPCRGKHNHGQAAAAPIASPRRKARLIAFAPTGPWHDKNANETKRKGGATGCKNGTALRCLGGSESFFLPRCRFPPPGKYLLFLIKKRVRFLCGLGILRRSDVSVGLWTGGAVIPSVTSRKPCCWLFPLNTGKKTSAMLLARTHSHLLWEYAYNRVITSLFRIECDVTFTDSIRRL